MTVLDLIPRTEKETLKFRLLAVLVVALAFLLRADDVALLPGLAVVIGYLIYSAILRTFLIPRFTSYPLLAAILVIDVGTVIAALHIIGLDSPIFGLLPIVVVYYAVYLGYAGGMAAAVISSVSFTGLAFGSGKAGEIENILAFQPFFYILALLVGYITKQRFQESQERQSLQQLISAEANAKSLLDLAQALNRVMDPVAVASDVAAMGALVAKTPLCAIFTFDPEGEVLVYQGSNFVDKLAPGSESDGLSLSLQSGSFVSQAWTSSEAAYLDEQLDAQDGMGRWLHQAEVRRAVAFPLTSQGEKVGVICFLGTDESTDLQQDTLKQVDSFSRIAGRILARTQLYSQAERRSRKVASELQQNIEMAGRFRELAERRSMRFGQLIIDPGRESVRWQDTSLRLTKTEFDLLYVLAEKSGNVVNQETLTREVWGADYVPQGKVVDVTIHRLRRKLIAVPDGKKLIQTVRGQGYSFVPPDRFAASR